jgi:hypothetical protein
LELWRHVIEDFQRASTSHDWQPWLDRLAAVCDPEIEWDASEVAMPDLAGVFHGPEAVVHWWDEWLAAWETVDFEYELIDAGHCVVLLLRQSMRGRSTGIEVPLGEYAHLARFEGGLMVYWKSYVTQAEALAAAGLSTEGASTKRR